MLSALVAATTVLLVNRDLDHALHCAIDALGAHLNFDRVYLMRRDSKARELLRGGSLALVPKGGNLLTRRFSRCSISYRAIYSILCRSC
jgi:hypothetical protein